MIRTFLVFYLMECVLTQWCPKSFHFTNNSGDLQSPRPHGALLYPDNIRCEWSITIPDQVLQVKLSFNTFDLEECHECKCDYVEVFDYIGAKRISFGRFCGSVLPGPFFSSEQTLSVVFKSDHGDSFSGFTASYSPVLPGAVCRNFTHINTGVGNIHSPEFASRDYPNNMDCMWQITTPPNTRINLKVISMSIQSCDDCKCDFLEIRDGNSSSDRLLAKFCGSKLPGDLYSSGRHLWVRFKSDGEHVESGFAAMFKSSVIKENYCPAIWKYPFRCPKELNKNDKSTGVCCYNNGPDCCHSGGRRCSDKRSSERDYCPRPRDDIKLKYCCITEEGEPSCCASSGVCHKLRLILLLGVFAKYFLRV